MDRQHEFDELTSAIAKHNKAIALTIAGAEKSVLSAREQLNQAEDQLRRAEESLDLLKKHIIRVVGEK